MSLQDHLIEDEDEEQPAEPVLSIQGRRELALQKLDAGHQALLQSLEGLDSEDAFLGSRWSVWETLRHLDAAGFVDSLEKIAAGALEAFPPFTNRKERLAQDLKHLEATFQRLRNLVVNLPEEKLIQPVTPPNPANHFPGLTMLELIERICNHEANHARQIILTRRYVKEFSARKRAVTIVGLPDTPELVSPRVRELVSYADIVAGSAGALALVRPWIRGVENVFRNGNETEILSRMGREAGAGIWSLVCCLGDPAQAHPGLIALARQHCPQVVIYPPDGVESR